MLTDLIIELNQRKPILSKFRDYYDGKQRICFVGDSLQTDFGKKLEGLTANRCNAVVDAVLDRLQIVGIEDDDATSDSEQQAEEFWKDANLTFIARQVMADAMIAGDGYVIAWPVPGGMDVAAQNPELMAVAYDDERPDELYAALKVWKRRDGTWRANLYYRDRLEKYESTAKGVVPPEPIVAWQHYSDSNESWPIQYNWNRVPVFHLSTNSRIGEYGKSDLSDIIPLQDRLNQTLANEAVAEEFQGFRQRWATGIQPVQDENGEYVNPFDKGADQLWISTNGETKFGEFSAADLGQLEAVAEGHEARIARTARIPQYYLSQSGSPPSGESLKTIEGPFVSKVKARQSAYGVTFGQLLNFYLHALGVANPSVRVRWASAESRMEGELLTQALRKISVGVSQAQVMRELGYTEEQIAEFVEENQEAERIKQQFFDAA